MRIDLVLELLDSPGQLLKALEPISVFGANLVTVIHKRDYKNENGKVPVQLTLEGEHEDLKQLVDKFEELGFSIIELDGVVRKETITTISTALINVEADIGKKQIVFDKIAEIAEEKKLLVINEV